MKPKVNDQKCGASKDACKVIVSCPVGAISYVEVDVPILDRNVECGTLPTGKSLSGCGCSCACGDGSNGCGGSPYGRIVIDYDLCIECGVCAEECCGAAIKMVE